MKKRNWKKFARWGIGIVLLCSIVVLPYLLKFLNSRFNSLLGTISLSTYISCVATLFTGVLAIAISINALQISKKAEKRDQQQNMLILNLTKRTVHEYLKGNSSTIYDVSRNLADRNTIKDSTDVNVNLERLLAFSVITKKQYELCRKMSQDMQYIKAASCPQEGINGAQNYVNNYLDVSVGYQENNAVKELLSRLQTEGGKEDA